MCIRPWAGGCWEEHGCEDVMLSVEVNGCVGVELSVEVELSWDTCVRTRGSFSVFTDWISWIPPSVSSTPLSLTDKHVRSNYILLLLKRVILRLLLLHCIIITCPCIHRLSVLKNELRVVSDFNWTFMIDYLLYHFECNWINSPCLHYILMSLFM